MWLDGCFLRVFFLSVLPTLDRLSDSPTDDNIENLDTRVTFHVQVKFTVVCGKSTGL